MFFYILLTCRPEKVFILLREIRFWSYWQGKSGPILRDAVRQFLSYCICTHGNINLKGFMLEFTLQFKIFSKQYFPVVNTSSYWFLNVSYNICSKLVSDSTNIVYQTLIVWGDNWKTMNLRQKENRFKVLLLCAWFEGVISSIGDKWGVLSRCVETSWSFSAWGLKFLWTKTMLNFRCFSTISWYWFGSLEKHEIS